MSTDEKKPSGEPTKDPPKVTPPSINPPPLDYQKESVGDDRIEQRDRGGPKKK